MNIGSTSDGAAAMSGPAYLSGIGHNKKPRRLQPAGLQGTA